MSLKLLRQSFLIFLVFTVITGILYPLGITLLAQLLFSDKANGSLVQLKGTAVGSELIGQSFSDPKYFWSRPSATMPYPYNAASSVGSNYGPVNPQLIDGIRKRVSDLKTGDPQNTAPVPVDLVTASASGIDPHISVAAALYQIDRVARYRGINPERLHSLVIQHIDDRQFGFLGEPRVNVLKLNLALNEMQEMKQ